MKRLLIAILAAGSLLLPAGCAAPVPSVSRPLFRDGSDR